MFVTEKRAGANGPNGVPDIRPDRKFVQLERYTTNANSVPVFAVYLPTVQFNDRPLALDLLCGVADNGLNGRSGLTSESVVAHLLLIDDDPVLVPEQVRQAFPSPKHRVDLATTGAAGLE